MVIGSIVQLPAAESLPAFEVCILVRLMKLKVTCAKGMKSVIGRESKKEWHHHVQKAEERGWHLGIYVRINYDLGEAVRDRKRDNAAHSYPFLLYDLTWTFTYGFNYSFYLSFSFLEMVLNALAL